VSGAYHDHDEDALAQEGVQAFNRMTAAMQDLGATLKAVDKRQQIKLADEEAEASTARLAAQDAKDAAKLALQAAKTSARNVAAWAVLGALAGVLVAGGVGYWIGQSSGWKAGQAAGYAAAVDQKAAASWANTPSGKLALALDQNGSLAMLATCNNSGWTVEARAGRRLCFVNPAPDGKNYGWTLP
jgi:hypothetical protein